MKRYPISLCRSLLTNKTILALKYSILLYKSLKIKTNSETRADLTLFFLVDCSLKKAPAYYRGHFVFAKVTSNVDDFSGSWQQTFVFITRL